MDVSWWAAWHSDGAPGVQKLLDGGAHPDARDGDGATSLFPAARAGDVRLLRALLAAGAEVNAHGNTGETPLLLAAESGSIEAVRVLLESGARCGVRDDSGASPLHKAAGVGDPELIDTLLGEPISRSADAEEVDEKPVWHLRGQQVDLDARDASGCTPLHYAVDIEDSDVFGSVGKLITAGADPNARDNDGETPLHDAASGLNSCAVRALLQYGASPQVVDKEGLTPLHRLVQNSPEEDPELQAFEALLGAAADPNATDNAGRTPLHHAVAADCDDATFVAALLRAESRPNARDRRGRTPLHHANGGWAFKALFEGGADPDARDEGHGGTFLHVIARGGDAEGARLLLDADASVQARDGDGLTPLHLAVMAGNAEVAEVLVAAGADPYDKGGAAAWSPIDEANERIVPSDMVRALVGDPNARNQSGRTPLHEAAAAGLHNWLHALIRAGADPNVRDADRRTPLHEAEISPSLMEALIDAGGDPSVRDKDGNTPEMAR